MTAKRPETDVAQLAEQLAAIASAPGAQMGEVRAKLAPLAASIGVPLQECPSRVSPDRYADSQDKRKPLNVRAGRRSGHWGLPDGQPRAAASGCRSTFRPGGATQCRGSHDVRGGAPGLLVVLQRETGPSRPERRTCSACVRQLRPPSGAAERSRAHVDGRATTRSSARSRISSATMDGPACRRNHRGRGKDPVGNASFPSQPVVLPAALVASRNAAANAP